MNVFMLTMRGLISLFPTQIYIDPPTISNYDLVQAEVKTCLDTILSKDDLNEVSWVHADAKKRRDEKLKENSEHFYLFKDDLIGKYKLDNLKTRIFEAVDRYITLTRWSRIYDTRPNNIEKKNYSIALRNSWINIQSKSTSHDWHCHPGYTIAGVYYMRVSEQQGGIQFQNPNILMQNCYFPENQRSSATIEILPSDGEIVLFPAWLMHNTMPNTSEEDRISVAFNIDIITDPYEDDPGNCVQDFTGKSAQEMHPQRPE